MYDYSRFKITLSIALILSLLLSLGSSLTEIKAAEGSGEANADSQIRTSNELPAFEEELVVKLRAEALEENNGSKLVPQETLSSLSIIPQLSFGRMFTQDVLPVPTKSAVASAQASVFERYYSSKIPSGADVEQLLKTLKSSPLVETAYVTQKPEKPTTLSPNTTPVQPTNDPRFSLQKYSEESTGINAPYAWQFEGGDGKGVSWADVEWSWALNHEDLIAHNIQQLPGGTNIGDGSHGTAVLGVVSAADNAIGNIGLANKAKPYVSSLVRASGNWSITEAILTATQTLQAGDVILLEVQVGSNNRWLPIESQQAEFDAIQYATSLGIVVVSAGGNGNVDLDQYLSGDNKYTFNPDSPDFKDSGSILVGAGSSTFPHYRLSFSNHGNRVDVHGIGENVATLNSTDVSSTTGYTDYFSGTSSASPVVVGAILQLQGIAKAKFGVPYTPAEIRRILRWLPHQTSSIDPANDRIGALPDLKKIIQSLPTPGSVPTDIAAPSAPANLVTSVVNGANHITWSAATDNVGLIGYDVYLNNNLLPFKRTTGTSVTLSDLPSGAFNITVKARDGYNQLSSASNSVHVNNSLPTWSASTVYLAGNIVGYQGVKYQAKWWNQNERPDLKSSPNDVWINLGPY
ncbi:S8 family serine peptidase [Paenibacillus sp. GSMTC-2017]|uniref:S8 family serine peptidase n=1 Tax=Paenibacillus sp. GSMTC-2017 TaxID=2794350 RepID=UPI0018D7A7F2|nr:S8 family serine peptidase [Paenibacillus sp. GSMTC-2017]MBH5320211.1 S8 family serine peptidase [Paenibacillus sp. GSMTC-2017]